MNRSQGYQVGQWSHGLFNCFDNIGICVVTYLVPCVTFGQSAEKVGAGGCFMCGCLYFVPIVNILALLDVRAKIRESRGIDGTTIHDCLTIMCCPLCALAQEAMELEEVPTGFSMSRE